MRPRRASSGIGQPRSAGDQLGGAARGRGSGSVELVEGHDLLGDGPGDGDLAVGVAGDQPGLQPGPRLHRQVIDAAAQHSADAIERITAAPAVPGLALLYPAAAHSGPGPPPRARPGRCWRSSPTRSGRRCGGQSPRSPAQPQPADPDAARPDRVRAGIGGADHRERATPTPPRRVSTMRSELRCRS